MIIIIPLTQSGMAVLPRINRLFGFSGMTNGWAVTQSEINPPLIFLMVFSVLSLPVIFGFYVFSEAGLTRRFPLMRTVLLIIGSKYTLRGMEIFSQVIYFAQHPHMPDYRKKETKNE